MVPSKWLHGQPPWIAPGDLPLEPWITKPPGDNGLASAPLVSGMGFAVCGHLVGPVCSAVVGLLHVLLVLLDEVGYLVPVSGLKEMTGWKNKAVWLAIAHLVAAGAWIAGCLFGGWWQLGWCCGGCRP